MAVAKKASPAPKKSAGGVAKVYPVLSIPISKIEISNNYRKKIGDLTELAASIQLHGVQQPILVRVKGKGFQLVYGQRRILGSKEVGLTHIPAQVAEEMDDAKFYELQMIENGQREDVHPLETAEGYERWLAETKKSKDELAERVGKSRSSVYGALKLLELCPEGRTAFYDGVLTASTALYVARIPHPKLQAEAVKELRSYFQGDKEPMSARDVQHLVHRRYMLELKAAPFDKKDAALVPASGPCTTCPKRSGNCKELFPDVKSEDVCTDTQCFTSKVDANWSQEKRKAAEKDWKVLPAKEAEGVFYYDGQLAYNAPYVALSSKCEGDDQGRTYRQLLKGVDLPVVLAQDKEGRAHQLLPKAGLAGLLKSAGRDFGSKPKRTDNDVSPAQKQEREKRERLGEVKAAVVNEVLAQLIPAVGARGLDAAVLRLIIDMMLDSYTDLQPVADRRNHDVDQLLDLLKTMEAPQLLGVLFEMGLGDRAASPYVEGYGKHLETACALFSIDLAAIHKRLEQELAAARAASKKEGKKAPKRHVPAAPPFGSSEGEAGTESREAGPPRAWRAPEARDELQNSSAHPDEAA